MISQGARTETVGRSGFSGQALGNWSASRTIATRWVARASRRATAGSGAARHAKAGLFFAKFRRASGPQEGIAKFRAVAREGSFGVEAGSKRRSAGFPRGRRPAARLFEAVVGGGRYEIEFWLGPIATFRSPSSAVLLGTPTGVLQSLKGVGDGPNFLRGQAKKRWGLAKGAQPSWLRSLPTFCRITESRSPRGSSGGEERD